MNKNRASVGAPVFPPADLRLDLMFGFIIRLVVIFYSCWHDANMNVKFTDIDYKVFSDAASHVSQGESPYMRPTYRYTPLLAWMLLPNVSVCAEFGKLLFVLFELLAAWLVYQIGRRIGYSHMSSVTCCQVALYNPLPLAVSCRGNAESVMSVLTLATIYLLGSRKWSSMISAAVVYGLSVHVKIYPVIYSLPIYLYLDENFTGYKSKLKILRIDVWPNVYRVVFIAVSVSVCGGLTAFCYYMYGYEFIYETYLYHIFRRDIKHNFSPYFYLLYFLEDAGNIKNYVGSLLFVPQMLLCVGLGYKLYQDLPYCFFMQTFMFVSFNKVCTSQYFLWYLAYLPLLLPRLSLSLSEGGAMILLWFLGQAAWLLPAYYLEFQGLNTFFYIWLASMVFLTINVWCAWKIMTHYEHRASFVKGKRVNIRGKQIPDLGRFIWKKKHI